MLEPWKFYVETTEIWQDMIADIESAKKTIELEQYSFWDDRVGRKFLEALDKKHSEGVQIKILLDGWGSYPMFTSSFFKEMVRKGVSVQSYNPPSLFRVSSWFYHTHKKTLVIDGEIAWLGGIGIKNKFTGFRDSMVRMSGPIVEDIKRSFENLWADTGRKKYFAATEFDKTSQDPKLLINYAGFGRKEIYEKLRTQIQKAEKSIYLTTSYFFPDRNFFQLLLDAANRGVDIKMILRGKDDEFLPVRFSTSYFHKALKAGIGIYRYDSAIIHAKTAIIDDKWATLGSSNLDKFSFYYNIEANIASSNPAFVTKLHQQFMQDLRNCREIKLADWNKRPLVERLIEFIIWPIHNYL